MAHSGFNRNDHLVKSAAATHLKPRLRFEVSRSDVSTQLISAPTRSSSLSQADINTRVLLFFIRTRSIEVINRFSSSQGRYA